MNKIIIFAAMICATGGAYAGTAATQLGGAAGTEVADTAVTAPAPLPVRETKADCLAYPAAPGCPAFCRHHHGFPGCSQYGRISVTEKSRAGVPSVPVFACRTGKGGKATLTLAAAGKETGYTITADPEFYSHPYFDLEEGNKYFLAYFPDEKKEDTLIDASQYYGEQAIYAYFPKGALAGKSGKEFSVRMVFTYSDIEPHYAMVRAICAAKDDSKKAGNASSHAGHGAGPDGQDEFGPEDGTGSDQGPAGGGPDDVYDGGGCGSPGSDGGWNDGPDGSGGVLF